MYCGDTHNTHGRNDNFKPNSNMEGTGSVKAIIVLYSIKRPSLPPRLVLAAHKCNGKGSGSGGHFMVGWQLRKGSILGTLVASVAEHILGVRGWGARMGLNVLEESEFVETHKKAASFAFPKALLSYNCGRKFPPYDMSDVLGMHSVAPRLINSHLHPMCVLPPPPPKRKRCDIEKNNTCVQPAAIGVSTRSSTLSTHIGSVRTRSSKQGATHCEERRVSHLPTS